MFKSARVKLAGWYLLVMAVVVFFFSGIVYFTLSRDLERGFHRAKMTVRMNDLDGSLSLSNNFTDLPLEARQEIVNYFTQDIQQAKQNLLKRIILIDGIILSVSAGLGYFLAGKTLAPIEKALEKQKRFVADASHELRTPLAVMKTATEVVLRDKNLSRKQAEQALRDNLEEVDDLSSLVNKLLALSHYQQEGNGLDKRSISLQELIEDTVKKIIPLAQEKEIDVEVDLQPGEIIADMMALRETLLVLLDNAIKYTPSGGQVKITARRDGRSWQILVKDTGQGIAQKDLPHVFERFWRGDKSRQKSVAGGYGLGLSLAKEIIDLHQGQITVTSQIDKGTVFTITLPRV